MKKKYCLALAAVLISFFAFAQEDEIAHGPASAKSFTEDNSPFSNARASYCSYCRRRHNGGCTPSTPTPVPFDGGL